MTTPSHTTLEIKKEVDHLYLLFPRLAARVTHLRTIFDDFETAPLNPDAIDLWVEDVKSVTTDLLTLLGNTREVIRNQLNHQALPHKE